MAFGQHIKMLRERSNVTAAAIANLMGVEAERYRKWEQRDVDPRELDLIKVENFFGIGMDAIMKLKKIPPDLLKEKTKEIISSSYIEQRRELKNSKEYIVPFYDAGATAGNELTNTETAITDPVGSISVGHFLSDAQAAIRIYGNSMMSNYPPGCILGMSELKERIIQPGEVYVIETEEQRIFKRLFYKNDDPDSDVLLCYSDNTMLFQGGSRDGKAAYPPFYVPIKNIRKINIVVGVVKRNSNLLIR